MSIDKRTGQIVAILSIILFLYALFFLQGWKWEVGSLIVGVIGAYIGWWK